MTKLQELVTSPWNASLSRCMGYHVTYDENSFDKCVATCGALGNGSTVAVFPTASVDWELVAEVTELYTTSTWVTLGNQSAVLEFPGFIPHVDMSKKYPCLCQRPINATSQGNVSGTYLGILATRIERLTLEHFYGE